MKPDLGSALERFMALINASRGERTPLTPAEEARYRRWVREQGITDADHPESKYDYRGAFKARARSAINPTDNAPHWPDTFKQHGHPTFSEESRYSLYPGDGGTWRGEQFTPAPTPTTLDTLLRKLGLFP